MTKLEACFTQLANKGAIGELKAAKLIVDMLTRFPASIKREDMEAMASSAKEKLLALVEARADPFAEGAGERDQPFGQANAIPHECARTEDLVRRPVEGDGDFGLLGENRSARPTDMNSTSHLPPASPVRDAGGDSPP
jgi:hypothetical protein